MKKKILIGMVVVLIGLGSFIAEAAAPVGGGSSISNCDGGNSCPVGKGKKTNLWGKITCCCCNASGTTGTYHGTGVVSNELF